MVMEYFHNVPVLAQQCTQPHFNDHQNNQNKHLIQCQAMVWKECSQCPEGVQRLVLDAYGKPTNL